MQNFIKIGQMVFEISRLFDFQDGCYPPSWILNFLNICGHQVERVNVHHHTEFYQNQSNGCRDIAFNVFQIAAVCHVVIFALWQ